MVDAFRALRAAIRSAYGTGKVQVDEKCKTTETAGFSWLTLPAWLILMNRDKGRGSARFSWLRSAPRAEGRHEANSTPSQLEEKSMSLEKWNESGRVWEED